MLAITLLPLTMRIVQTLVFITRSNGLWRTGLVHQIIISFGWFLQLCSCYLHIFSYILYFVWWLLDIYYTIYYMLSIFNCSLQWRGYWYCYGYHGIGILVWYFLHEDMACVWLVHRIIRALFVHFLHQGMCPMLHYTTLHRVTLRRYISCTKACALCSSICLWDRPPAAPTAS